MTSHRDQAEYLRLALAMNLVDKNAAIDWADRTILAFENPSIEIIDVSMEGDQPPDLMRLLASVPGQGDLAAVAHQILGILHGRLEAGHVTLEQVMNMFLFYKDWAAVSENERWEAENFSDELYCAQEGHYGTLDSVREGILEPVMNCEPGIYGAFRVPRSPSEDFRPHTCRKSQEIRG
jgi:hypothetical protein